MHQIWADRYTQETVIKRTTPCLLTMQIYSDSELIFLNRVNDIAFCWRNFVAKLIFSICYAAFILNFGFLEEIIEKNYRKLIYQHFPNYRQNYRYRYKTFKFIGDLKELSAKLLISKLAGDLLKNYWYKKNDLSPTPI